MTSWNKSETIDRFLNPTTKTDRILREKYGLRNCQKTDSYWEAVGNVGKSFGSAVFSTPTPARKKIEIHSIDKKPE